MKNILTAGAAILAVLAAQTGTALADKGNMNKLGGALEHVYYQSHAAQAPTARSARSAPSQMGMAGPNNELKLANVSVDGYVTVDAIASGVASDLEVTIESLGGRNISTYGRVVSAQIPADRLGDLANSGSLAFARPAFMETNVGTVTSQGDRSMRTDIVRTNLGFDGTGLTIGVLSDSFACDPGSAALAGGPYTTPAEDEANDDLPPGVVILSDFLDQTACIDEGRGMAQLIHDVAPGAKIMFHTAFNGQADFAGGIVELALAGADVIVDDVIYFTEPMFQDGIIAQAADEVARLGVPYYSSNGNRARDAFEADYRPVAATIDTTTGTWHDFDQGAGVDLLKTVTLDGSLQTNLTFQWDNPNFSVSGGAGAQTDVDVVMFDAAGVRVAECFDDLGNFVFPANGLCQFQFTDGGIPIDGGNGGDALELVSLVDFVGGSEIQLGLLTESGSAPGFVKYVIFGGGIAASEYAIDAPSGFGHNNAQGAEAVGAAAFYFTEELEGDPNTLDLRAQSGESWCVPACLNDFSSAGGTPIIFRTDGSRYYWPRVRIKPGITGPDGGNTSFFINDTSRDDDNGDGVFATGEPGEFPNFFGTSASAPHVASIAALMIDAEDSQILGTGHGGGLHYRMCKPRRYGHIGSRRFGRTRHVDPADVQQKVDDGWLLGPCSRTEPGEIYWTMRLTAQDMSIRASNATGETVQVFDEIGFQGFDRDSGFGFVDGPAAMRKFLRRHGHGHGH